MPRIKSSTTLTHGERAALESSGHSKHDVQEILAAIRKTSYFMVEDGQEDKPISEDEALALLGREEWIRGLARSTFHAETTRYALNGQRVKMVSRVWS